MASPKHTNNTPRPDKVLVLYRGQSDGQGYIQHEGPIIVPAADRPALVLESGGTMVERGTVEAFLNDKRVAAMVDSGAITVLDDPCSVLRKQGADLFPLISVTRDPQVLQAWLDGEANSAKPRQDVLEHISDRLTLHAKHKPIQFTTQDLPDLAPAKAG